MSEPYDVCIVGAGPVGLTAALLMRRLGLSTLLLEQREGPIGHPAGHVINPRSMEIWRQIDPSIESDIREQSAPVDDIRHIVWCTSLAGSELGRIDTVPSDPGRLAHQLSYSPSRHAHFPQSRLEALLWSRVQADEAIRFVTGAHVTSAIQQDGEVRLTAQRGEDRLHFRARYCLAADGARSTLRRELGIAMPGPTITRVASVHFRARLDRYIHHRPAVIYWIYNQGFVGPLIRHADDQWILMTVLHPPQEADHFDEARWRQLIVKAVGSPAVDVRIENVGAWAMTAQVAERFREGRIFLVGDAAHRFPPTGGYGINTGVQDVHNLAWKLAAVMAGEGSDALLDSYESERRPVAEINCRQSLDNQAEMDSINAALAVRMDDLRKLHDLMSSSWYRRLPRNWQLGLADALPRIGMRKMAVLDTDTTRARHLREHLRQAVSGQLAHFGAHGVELGYRYSGPLVLADDRPGIPSTILDYVPGTTPGERLPHAWLWWRGEKRSTLDMLPVSGLSLIVDPAAASVWRAALRALETTLAYPVSLSVIGDAADMEVSSMAPGASWHARRGVEPGGALLVRPDGHVVWRIRTLPAKPADTLSSVFARLAGLFPTVSRTHAQGA